MKIVYEIIKIWKWKITIFVSIVNEYKIEQVRKRLDRLELNSKYGVLSKQTN